MALDKYEQWVLDTFGVDPRDYDRRSGTGQASPALAAETPPNPQPAGPRAPGGPLPPAQKHRADAALARLSPADQAHVNKLLDGAGSEAERQYVLKALAAGHGVAELAAFDREIHGKDAAWLNDHLRLVGSSHGRGIMQQWSYSCGPTTVEAIRGELDPIYALHIRRQNPNFETADDADPTRANPHIAADQKAMLEQGGGNPTSRDDPKRRGAGLVFQTLLNTQTAHTGQTYGAEVIGEDVPVEAALNTIDADVRSGLPVPITVGSKTEPFAHAALVTAVESGPPRRFTIHDPYFGVTATFSEKEIETDAITVGGWNHLGVVFPPTLKR